MTTIGEKTFSYCSGLTSIISFSGADVQNNIFEGCTSIVSLTINFKTIYDWFKGMNNIKEVVIGDETKSIESSAFSGCTGLTSLTIGNGVTSIGSRAFRGCEGLTSVTIPNSVTSIGNNAFDCNNLSEVHISDIASWCNIWESRSDTDMYVLSEYLPFLHGYHLFINGEEVTDLVIPEGVTKVGECAFAYCEGLSTVAIPNSVTEIGTAAFYNCSGLNSINIPEGVTAILDGAFKYCTSLTSITLPNSVTTLEKNAWAHDFAVFGFCTNLTSVTLSNSLKNIPTAAFEGCSSLTSIEIPNSVTTIGWYAFYQCSSLASIEIPKSVTSIGNAAFFGCSSLASIKVEEGNPVYDSRDNCNAVIETATNTTRVVTPYSVLPNTVTEIGNYNPTESPITIPISVTYLGNDYINNHTQFLLNLEMNKLEEWIGLDRLNDSRLVCSYVDENGMEPSSIVIPDGLTTIGSNIFRGISGLKSVTIPSSITSIGNSAFADCGNITEVNCYIEDLFGISSDCFSYSVKQNAKLYVPKEMRIFYKLFDGWKEFKNIIAMENSIEPVDANDDINYGSDDNFNSSTDLNGTVIGNIYYNIADDKGEYSSTEGCIVIKQPTTDQQVENIAGQNINNEELKDSYTGIIFMVQAGSGTITVNAEATGGMTLKVKVGNNTPMEFKITGKMEAKIPYTVTEPSYVYVYAGGGSAAGAKAVGATSANSDDVLKIYGIEWTSGTDGISTVSPEADIPFDVYTLTGNKVRTNTTTLKGLPRGVYVVNGRKVVVE